MSQPTRAEQMDSDFVRFLTDNPTVYPQFRMLAVKLKAKELTAGGPRPSGKCFATRWLSNPSAAAKNTL